MSVTREVTIWCDGQASTDEQRCSVWEMFSAPMSEARKNARERGWHHVNPRRDICPSCWAAGKR